MLYPIELSARASHKRNADRPTHIPYDRRAANMFPNKGSASGKWTSAPGILRAAYCLFA
jgi:hypothetical protein